MLVFELGELVGIFEHFFNHVGEIIMNDFTYLPIMGGDCVPIISWRSRRCRSPPLRIFLI